ncbi:MAG: spermidine synthase [Verrucomicrobiota bacterium]
MASRTRVVSLFLFGSGFCALIYQTTWLREFRLIFGASTAASAAVLGVFMAGLGFGGIVLGRRSEAKSNPLAFYAKLELFIALSAAFSPLLILAARQFYIAVGGTLAMGLAIGTIARLILAALILGPPTFLMGGTLPAAARAVVAPDDVSRRTIGVLYGVNTLGAVSGALLGTFYLFENFGNHLTLWWATALNFIVALSAFRFAKSLPKSESREQIDDEQAGASVNQLFVFIAAALVGFAFFLMEIVWYRMLGPLLGGSTFSFGLILAVALLGIGLGGVTYAFLDLRRSASLSLFALTCAGEALFIALPYALGDRIATATMLLRPLGTLGFYGHVIAWSAICFVVVFPPAFISGIQFPLLVALLGKGRRGVGSQTGAAYAWNTIGALIGSLAGGFGLIPLLSAPGVWKLVIVILSALAILAACIRSGERGLSFRRILPISTAALALVMLMATGPTAFWRHGQIGVGRLKYYHASPNELRDAMQGIRRHIIWEADGIESSVGLQNADSVSFIVNGKSDGNARFDAGTQVMSGLIGAALHPNPKQAMVIGLGTGSTAGWLAAVPTIDRVDVVELEPAVLTIAKACAPVNGHALENPKLHLTIGDGRELLLTVRSKYDVIVSEPSNPYRAGIAGLFTREFYESIRNRLNSGGIFLQWVQTYSVDDRTVEIIYRTLGSVFLNIESWQTEEGDLLLAASQEPLQYDAEVLRGRLAAEPFKSAMLAAWRGIGLEDFLAHYVGNKSVADVLQNLESWPLNTDDRTVIEFAFARSVGASNGFQIPNLRDSAHVAHCDRPEIANGGVDWDRVEEARQTSFNQPIQTGSIGERNRVAAFLNYRNGDLASALHFWRSQSQEPKTVPELELVAECLAVEANEAALRYIDELAAIVPSDAEAIRAQLYWKQGKIKEAAENLERFLQTAHKDAWPNEGLIKRSIGLAETMACSDRAVALAVYDSLRTPLCVWNGETDRELRLVSVAVCLDGNKPGEYTARAVEALEPNVIWDRHFLELRKAAYVSVNNPRSAQAARDLDDFMQSEALTTDTAALTREIEIGSGRQSHTPR